jgi:hypothetical protein
MGAGAEYGLDGKGLPLPHIFGRGTTAARSNGSLIFLALGSRRATARRLAFESRKQLVQGAPGRCTEAFVEMNGLGTLSEDCVILPGKLGMAGEGFIDPIGIARIQGAGRMPRQQHLHFSKLLSRFFCFFAHRYSGQAPVHCLFATRHETG